MRHWLAEGKLVFIYLLVIAASIILGFVIWSSEVLIRSSGSVLQFIGMLFAIRGLLSIRAELESLHAGDLIKPILGLVWLTKGITISTMSPELYKWLY